jgi:hypothetical protein
MPPSKCSLLLAPAHPLAGSGGSRPVVVLASEVRRFSIVGPSEKDADTGEARINLFRNSGFKNLRRLEE